VNPRALLAWAAGFGVYHACAKTGFAGGASIPAMALAAAIYLLISMKTKGRT
jgi:hypothetical protein